MLDHANLFITVVSVAVSAGVAWGIAKAKIVGLEREVDLMKKNHTRDHDLLVKLDTKMDMLLDKKGKK